MLLLVDYYRAVCGRRAALDGLSCSGRTPPPKAAERRLCPRAVVPPHCDTRRRRLCYSGIVEPLHHHRQALHHYLLFSSNNPRWISLTTVLFRNERSSRHHAPADDARTRNNPAIAINKRLVALGKKKQWEELLIFAEQERRNFNNVNCATLMSQLGRIQSLDRIGSSLCRVSTSIGKTVEDAGTAVDPGTVSCKHCPFHWEDEAEESDHQENTRVDFRARNSCEVCNGRRSTGSCQCCLGVCQARF